MTRILCFGDSNTFGYKPDKSGRFDETIRWTARLQRMLGDNYQIVEEGLCGRTSIFEDPQKVGRKGLDLVDVLVESHNPIDVFVVMLGTNDCKTYYGGTAETIAEGLGQVIAKAQRVTRCDMKILVISPILLGSGVGEIDVDFNEASEEVSRELAGEYEKLARKNNFYFLDASKYADASDTDREHLDEQGHEKLADAIYDKLIEMLED